MSIFIGILGMLAFFAGIVMVIFSFFKKRPKRNPLIVIAVGLVLFIVGVALSGNSTSSESTKTASTTSISTKKKTTESSSIVKASLETSKSKEAQIKASKAKVEAAKQAELAKQAEAAKKAEEAKRSELAKQQAEQSRQAEIAKQQAEQSRQAELAKQQAEQSRQAEAAAQAQAATQQAQAEISTTETANNRTVYVVNNGTTKVYWYDASAIHPKPTHSVISMTEGEALARGLHHSQTE